MDDEHKALVAGLMVGTMTDLNTIDNMITSPSSTLGKRAAVVRNDLEKFVAAEAELKRAQQPQIPRHVPNLPPPPVPRLAEPIMVGEKGILPEKDQFEFDFDKRAKYQDILNAIERIEQRLEETFDDLFEQLDAIETKLDLPRPKREYKKKAVGIPNS